MGALSRFAAVRLLTGAMGLVWVFAIARWMPVPEYAIYAVVLAAVATAAIVATLGLDRVLYRQIPAAHAAGANAEVWRLMRLSLGVRLALAPLVGLLAAWIGAPADAPTYALAFAAALGASMAVSDTLGIAANALMRFEQQALVVATTLLLRIVAAAIARFHYGSLDIGLAMAIVLGGDLLQSVATLVFAVRPSLAPGRAPVADPSPPPYERLPLTALARAAFANYSSYLLALPWHGSAAVVIVGATAGAAQLATFGLLQGLLNRLRQYLPVQLLRGAFEPLLVRRYASDGDHLSVSRQVDLLRRLNLCLLLGGVVVAWPLGSALIAAATSGKYVDAGSLAALMLLALAVRGLSEVQFISANIMSEMPLLTRVYAVATLVSLVPLWWCANRFGAPGVVLVSVLPSLLLWAGMRARRALSASGVWRWRSDLRCALAVAPALALAFGLQQRVSSSWAAVGVAMLALAVYGGAVAGLRVFDRADLAMLRRNVARRVA